MFYLPQTPYMTVGTLVEQVIYPLNMQQAMVKLGLGLDRETNEVCFSSLDNDRAIQPRIYSTHLPRYRTDHPTSVMHELSATTSPIYL